MTPTPVNPLQSLPSQTTSWHLQETYKSLITISVECLKMLAIVNGGAAVAVLTYLANLASHAAAGQPTSHITPALLCYCGGLLATILAFVFGYVVQLQLYNEEIAIAQGHAVRRKHQWVLWTAMVLALSAAVAFGAGCLLAANALGV
jgi:hypothetical protein